MILAIVFGLSILAIMWIGSRKYQPAADAAHSPQLTTQETRQQWQAHKEYLDREMATAHLAIQQLDAKIQAETPAAPYTPRRCKRTRVVKTQQTIKSV